jgi:hypothetical protein
LTTNELRERVVLRVDGGMRTGRDILMMAALGADEFGFGTIAMIATGCVMARVCHTNNCPVGVASQRETLRARFPGVPADLVCLLADFPVAVAPVPLIDALSCEGALGAGVGAAAQYLAHWSIYGTG